MGMGQLMEFHRQTGLGILLGVPMQWCGRDARNSSSMLSHTVKLSFLNNGLMGNTCPIWLHETP